MQDEKANEDDRPLSTVSSSKTVQQDGAGLPTTMFNATHGIQPEWAAQIGKLHSIGIRLNVGVRFPSGEPDGIDYQTRGVVDVPAHPYGDNERNLLAQVMFKATDLPHKEKLEYGIVGLACCKWRSRQHVCCDVPRLPSLIGYIERMGLAMLRHKFGYAGWISVAWLLRKTSPSSAST